MRFTERIKIIVFLLPTRLLKSKLSSRIDELEDKIAEQRVILEDGSEHISNTATDIKSILARISIRQINPNVFDTSEKIKQSLGESAKKRITR